MEKKQIRPTKARLIGSILPNHTKLFQTTSYEDFHVLRAPNTNIPFKDISSVSYKIGSNINFVNTVAMWKSDAKASGSTTADANMRKATLNEDGSINLGVGYLTYYKEPLITDISSMPDVTINVTAKIPHNYSVIRLGTLNSQHNNIPEIRLVFYEVLDEDLSLYHTISYRFKDKVCYVFIDGMYMNISYDFSNTTGALYLGGYCGSAILQGVNVQSIQVLTGSTIYPMNLCLYSPNWQTQLHKGKDPNDTGIIVPSLNDGWYIGRYYDCVYNKFAVTTDTRNTRIKIKYETSGTGYYAVGLGYIDSSSNLVYGQARVISNSNPGYISAGEHEAVFEIGDTDVITVKLDNETTGTTSIGYTRYPVFMTSSNIGLTVKSIKIEQVGG